MKRILITICLCLFCVSPVFGFETGKWGVSSQDFDFDGRVHITKSGNNYKVPEVSFFRQETPSQFPGCGVDDGKVVDKGEELEVYDDGKLKFTIKKSGNSIQVIPHLVLNDPICERSQFLILEYFGKSIDEITKDVSELRWKKVKKF